MENETDPPAQLEDETDPLAEFGLDAIDLRWTLKDIAAKRSHMINKQHLAQLIELGLVEMREDVPHLTIAGQKTIWKELRRAAPQRRAQPARQGPAWQQANRISGSGTTAAS